MKCSQVSVNINSVKKFHNARVVICFNFLYKKKNKKIQIYNIGN